MTKKEIERLNDLRLQGLGPTNIAKELGISLSTVTSYIRRHPAPPGMVVCKECGAFITQAVGHRKHLFCSTACRTAWWNKHRSEGNKNTVITTCAYCGKEIRAYASDKRKYCSRDCYHKARRTDG